MEGDYTGSVAGGGEFRHSDQLHSVSGERADPRSGKNDAGEVQWVGRGYGDLFRPVLGAPNGAQQVDGLGARELFTHQPGDKAAAADLAAGLQSAQHSEQVAPGRGECLPSEQVTEYDAPAEQELIGERFVRCAGLFRAGSQQGPSSRRVPGPGRASFAFTAAALGVD